MCNINIFTEYMLFAIADIDTTVQRQIKHTISLYTTDHTPAVNTILTGKLNAILAVSYIVFFQKSGQNSKAKQILKSGECSN